MLPLPTPILTWPLTCGRRLLSPSLHTRSSQITWPRTTPANRARDRSRKCTKPLSTQTLCNKLNHWNKGLLSLWLLSMLSLILSISINLVSICSLLQSQLSLPCAFRNQVFICTLTLLWLIKKDLEPFRLFAAISAQSWCDPINRWSSIEGFVIANGVSRVGSI